MYLKMKIYCRQSSTFSSKVHIHKNVQDSVRKEVEVIAIRGYKGDANVEGFFYRYEKLIRKLKG